MTWAAVAAADPRCTSSRCSDRAQTGRIEELSERSSPQPEGKARFCPTWAGCRHYQHYFSDLSRLPGGAAAIDLPQRCNPDPSHAPRKGDDPMHLTKHWFRIAVPAIIL